MNDEIVAPPRKPHDNGPNGHSSTADNDKRAWSIAAHHLEHLAMSGIMPATVVLATRLTITEPDDARRRLGWRAGGASPPVLGICFGGPLVRRDAQLRISDTDLLHDRELVGEAVLVATADERGQRRRRGRVVAIGAIRTGSLIAATLAAAARAHDNAGGSL